MNEIDLIMKLSAEVERLRSALRQIADMAVAEDAGYGIWITARDALCAPSLNEASEPARKEPG